MAAKHTSTGTPRPSGGRRPTTPRPPEVCLDRDACHDLATALGREWLETDGAGGYAALTIPDGPTRRQHGLLVAPFPGNARRHVFLGRFEETLSVRGAAVPLSVARYPGLWAPHGHQTIEAFHALPWPTRRHRVGDVVATREVLLADGAHAVLVRWSVEGASIPVELALRPLLPFRDADALTVENGALNPRVGLLARGIRCRPYPELPDLTITVGGAPWRFEADPVWYRRTEYATDLTRGYEGHEDVFSPGTLVVTIAPGRAVVVAATIEAEVEDPVRAFAARASARRAAWEGAEKGLPGRLAHGADEFLARSAEGDPWVVAGFPWFYGWGRDTFLAVPGLFFARGRVEEGGDLLEATLPYLREGLFPNRFSTTAEDSDYRSLDAPFWFARAVRFYETAGGRAQRVRRRFLPALREILEGFTRGNALAVVDDGGLPRAHDLGEGANLTWMDARVDGRAVTPRAGAPVEIAALWVFLRRYVADLVGRTQDARAARPLAREADASAATFLARYRLPDAPHLADAWRDGRADPTVRPNMLFAAAAEWTPLSPVELRGVVETAQAKLLTPVGLRTLDPAHRDYRPRYEGSVLDRDAAYHQGTVWPWLLGPFVEASLAAYGDGPGVRDRLRRLLDGLAPATEAFGLGHLPEVFDGDPPHRPAGAFAQAWSDAEVLRAYALLRGGAR